MTADLLREAAAKMRAETSVAMQPWGPEVALAVADWLDEVLEQIQGDIWPFEAHKPWIQRPLTVARAYLGESR